MPLTTVQVETDSKNHRNSRLIRRKEARCLLRVVATAIIELWCSSRWPAAFKYPPAGRRSPIIMMNIPNITRTKMTRSCATVCADEQRKRVAYDRQWNRFGKCHRHGKGLLICCRCSSFPYKRPTIGSRRHAGSGYCTFSSSTSKIRVALADDAAEPRAP